MTPSTLSNEPRLIVPALAPAYNGLHDVAYTLLRVIAGVLLATHGWTKIQDPMSLVGMVEGLGFYPGFIWAPLLAGTEFFGGILLAIGLLTRPAALASSIVLLVTVYFHWIVKSQGLAGAEKSILWLAMTFLILVRGSGRYAVDRLIGRVF
ncbi:putative oxidoreductase [Comamonas sp. BIGb0124]|uniref:DoxX family protein n=1 Tax=Comamonas sp. BIGb0124 TaxID=2485130 RepID=UPI000F494DCB|nr:DoxX family protein [Comamonas sp. BIGb0124]ROR20934.1 putative oxidoreductase [Comamonas sp. BIGb0124]